MYRRFLGAFLLLIATTAWPQTEDRWSVTVGELRDSTGNNASAVVVNMLRGPGVMIHVTDRARVRSAAVFVSPEELRSLRALLDRAQASVDAAASAPASEALGAAASAAKR